MRVCLVSCGLESAFRALGHEVLSLRPPGGVMDLRSVPELRTFRPDLLLQQECLGGRVFLRHLDDLDCPRLFWAVDPHLNASWQAVYIRLFDAALSTQRAWISHLRTVSGREVRHLPWFGPWSGPGDVPESGLTPHAVRSRFSGFVGRVSAGRPVRQRMLELLSVRFGLTATEGLFGPELAAFYLDTAVVPNESIMGEVNFRLFEAASCGCAVVNPALDELDGLFDPGVEILTWTHGLELLDHMARLRSDPALSWRLGLRAWARVRAAHRPDQRVTAVLDCAATAARRPPDAQQSGFHLSTAAYREIGGEGLAVAELEAGLLAALPTPEIVAALLRLWCSLGRRDQVLGTLASLGRDNRHPDIQDLNMTAAGAALFHSEFPLARSFLLRAEKAAGRPHALPTTPAALCREFARLAERAGLILRPGLVFNPTRHLPGSALEWLLLAAHLAPDDLEIRKTADALIARQPGLENLRLGLLSHITLHERENWRAGLELGLANLATFRLDEGVQELALARDKAVRQGREALFERILRGRDRSGMITALLK